jgi:hypothetical protein
MAGSNEDHGRSRRPSVEDRGWSDTGQVLSGRVIGRSGDAVCSLHRAWEDEEHGFLGSTSKPRSTVYQKFGLKTPGIVCQWFSLKTTESVYQWFGLKTTGMVFPGLASKPVATVSPSLALKPVASDFLVWASKPAATVW